MTLIYVALQSEGQSIIEKYKLKKFSSNPKIYKNDTLLVVVGGIGKQNTFNSLGYIFNNFKIRRAVNIGIAGCSDLDVLIGELFCTNRVLEGIKYMQLTTVQSAQICEESSKTLYDMEGKYFLEISQKYLNDKDIFVFKVVSDHLDDTILPKDKVKKLIHNSLKSWEQWI